MRKLAIAINLFLLLLMLGSCGGSSRQKALDVSFVTLNAARDTFVTFDFEHQKRIVDTAMSQADAERQLANYRQRRDRVLHKFIVAYRLLATAALVNDEANISNMATALFELQNALRILREGGEP